MMNECEYSHGIETGGILIGKKIAGRFTVVFFALGPGIHTRRTHNRFSPDIHWQQAILDRLFNRHGVNYVGSYHLHPVDDCRPSFIDLKAARQIVSDPEWDVTEAIFPIISVLDNEMRFSPYYISRNSKNFQLIDWQIMPHSDPIVKHLLKKEK